MKLWTDAFCITVIFNVLRTLWQLVSICWGYYTDFSPVLGIFFHVLRNLKDYLDIFRKCLNITAVVTKLKIRQASLCFKFFWMFLVHFLVFSSKNREPSNIFLCMNFCFVFLFQIIEQQQLLQVEHTEMGHFPICICLFVCELS